MKSKRITDYGKLKNRCSLCSHKISMHVEGEGACFVATGADWDNTVLVNCNCKRVRP